MQEDISMFFRSIEDLKESIKSIEGTRFIHNHRRILLFGLLDLMAKVVYPTGPNKPRFVNFILEYCNWEHAKHIGLQQLVLVVNKDNSSQLSKVRNFANEKISKWPNSQPIVLSYDPSFSEVEELWPKNYKALGKFNLDHFTHANLFWALRNSLVHELRPLGYEFNLFEEKSPHYTPMSQIYKNSESDELRVGNHTWQLTYPEVFYYYLVDNAILKLKDYLITEQINPYDRFRFGSEWLDMTN